MVNKEGIMKAISQLRQKRHYAERRCETIGKMLSACLIHRPRIKGTRDFQSMRTMGAEMDYKDYGYLTCYWNGKNWYRYVRKQELDGVEKLTENYRIFCQSIQEVRSLNRRIVELLDKTGQIQQEDVKNYVQRKTTTIKRIKKK